jgi:IclR family transcriptional regulator, KDG regulon repressor
MERFRSIKSAERTLALFELFSSKQRPLTVGEITKFLGIPQPSVTMLLRNLTALGYLEHDRYERTYAPTIRIAFLGSWIHQAYVQERQLEWRLNQLFSAVEETTFIGIQNGVHVQYILFIKSESPHRFDVQARMARPLAVSAVGKALLSLKSDEEVKKLVHGANVEATESRFRADPQKLIPELANIRSRGYAETCGNVVAGIATIAMPVRPLLGQSPLAVAVGGTIERIKSKKSLILRELDKFLSALYADDRAKAEAAESSGTPTEPPSDVTADDQ